MASSATGFFQDPPALSNQFEDDAVLRSILAHASMPGDLYGEVVRDLTRFGAVVVDEVMLDAVADAEAHPPELVQYDAWGRRRDRIHTSAGWKHMKATSATEGLIAIAYDERYGRHARLYQFAKYYLFASSSAVYTCPLAMADGAARILKIHGGTDEAFRKAFQCLTSRDPATFWTSGQWMTERPGGSDVSRTETVATHVADDAYVVNGFKFFSSATDSDMAFLLARIGDSPRLSLFYTEIRTASGALNGIRIQRLKRKLGTRAVPTAELELVGMRARLVGEPGRGVATIATLLNITRLHTAVNSVSFLRRALAIATSYSSKRRAFGKLLNEHPLHMETLRDLEAVCRACMHLTFFVVRLLGTVESGDGTADDDQLLRLLTPVAKAWVSKMSVLAISECLEALGGQGYMEDAGLPRLLRDCQVNTIWEGTTNVLALDTRKVLDKQGMPELLWSTLGKEVSGQPVDPVCAARMSAEVRQIKDTLPALMQEHNARKLLFQLGELTSAALMIGHAGRTGSADDVAFARRWCLQRPLCTPSGRPSRL